tara:strand:+ start:1881 stop:4058 length:2178 start_codon:yes stop_codon:yes gene_type:complete
LLFKKNIMTENNRKLRIGIDTGGTFTDIVGVKTDTGEIISTKTPTTTSDPSLGLMKGIDKILKETKMRDRDISGIYHGTTVATNAILEEKFDNLGLIITSGFRHLLEIGLVTQKEHFIDSTNFTSRLIQEPLRALVPPERILEVNERISSTGKILNPVLKKEISILPKKFRELGVFSVGVCLLHSYANSIHEKLIRDLFEKEFPECELSISSLVSPEPGEYDRAITTLLDSFIKPHVKSYLGKSSSKIEDKYKNIPFLIMKSNGGVASNEEISKKPISTVLSGPAAGALSASYLGRISGIDKLITLDGGGTSTDIAIIEEGEAKRSANHKIGSFSLKIPMIDITTIGTGGGSIAWMNSEKRLKVGPQSAGANPGPVCYGQGGENPTVTDANLVLARSPLHLAGGEIKLNKALAMKAMRNLAKHFKIDPMEMAAGVVEITAWNQVHAIRQTTVKKGLSPQDFSLMAFGGSGPLTAGLVAEFLGIENVIVPPFAGMTSAFGLEVVDLMNEHIYRYKKKEDDLDIQELNSIFENLDTQATHTLSKENIPESRQLLKRNIRLQYENESNEIDIEVPSGFISNISIREVLQKFHFYYQKQFNKNFKDQRQVEITNLNIVSYGLTQPPNLPLIPSGDESAEEAYKGARLVWFPEKNGFVDTPIYYRERLLEGNFIPGPAVIESFGSTTVVFPKQEARVDRFGNLLLVSKTDLTKQNKRAGRATGLHGVGAA